MTESPELVLSYGFAIHAKWNKPKAKLIGDDLFAKLTDELVKAEFLKRTNYKTMQITFQIEDTPESKTIRKHYRSVKTLSIQPSISVGSLDGLAVPELRQASWSFTSNKAAGPGPDC